jgi:hypothetical protein
MKTVSFVSSMSVNEYIQLDTSVLDFSTSSTDTAPGEPGNADMEVGSAASVSGFVNMEYRDGGPDISDLVSLHIATAFDSNSGSQTVVHIAPDNAQNDGNITDHFTGDGGFVSSADVVTDINADIPITNVTGPDSGLIGNGNFAIVPDSTVDSFEPMAMDDSSVVSDDANDSDIFLLSDLTDSTGNLESSPVYSNVYPCGSGSIVPDNSFVAGSPLGFDGGAVSAASAVAAPSEALSSELPNTNPTCIYNAAVELHNSGAASSSSEGSAPPSIMTFGDLGQSPASLVQTTSAAPGDASSGLVINITYDASVANAPAGFEAVVASVVQFYESEFTNPVTLNIDVGWGEVDGQGLLSGALGESESYLESFSYSQIRSALSANATSSNQLSAVGSLPTSAPGNGTYYLTVADATALGLSSSGTTLDGYVGFSNSLPLAYNNSNGVPAGEYNLYGVVAHELSEVMGRVSLLDMSNSYSDLDLFRYSGPGALSLVGTNSGYISANGGNTSINYFNSNPSGDFGDWAGSAGNDAYDAFSNSGVINPVTQADLAVMNILGYNLASQTSPTPTPTITAVVETPSTGDLNAGNAVIITLDFSAAVTAAGGTPTLALNDAGTATYTGGSGTNALSFSYTVTAGQNTPALAVTAINLNGATITDSAGNAQLSLTGLPQAGPQIDTTTPAATSMVESPSNGVVGIGKVVDFTLGFNEAVTVSGTPTLTLNDGGIATFTGDSGNSLSFSSTVSATNSNAASLAATAVNLNGGSIHDGAGNNASLSLNGLSQTGPQVDTTAPTTVSIVETPSNGIVDIGKVVDFTLGFNEAVTASGTPTLTLNDGGIATFTGDSGNSLSFSYTVSATNSNVASLAATAVNLNGGSIQDGAGNSANLSLSGLSQTGPQVDTTIPTVTAVVEQPGTGDLVAGKTVTITLDFNEAVIVAGGVPTLTLNDGGTATYASGSASGALSFDYTVGAHDSSVASLAVNVINLNGGTIEDSGGNNASLSLTGLTQSGPQITVNALSPPTVTAQTPNQTWTQGEAVDLTLAANTFTDPQQEALIYSGTLASGAALPAWLHFNASTESFTGSVPSGASGLDIEVTATDTSGLSASETFAVATPSGPSVNASSFTVAVQQSVAASSFFTISNPSNDNITEYSFKDNGGGSGYFTLAGTAEPDGQVITVSASNLSGVQYVGGSSAGTDTLTVDAYDATTGTWIPAVSLSAVTTAAYPLANITDVTEALYIGYFGRAGDPGGVAYWVTQLNAGIMSEASTAASFSVQTETIGLYPFLASPSTASQAQITSFIESVYADLFDRAADSGGLAYWDSYLTNNLGNPQTVGDFILTVIRGALGTDQTTISNKVTVADYFTQELAAAGIGYTSAASTLAHSAIASVTSAASTVLAAESTISSWVATTTQSTDAEVALVGMSHTSLLSTGH